MRKYLFTALAFVFCGLGAGSYWLSSHGQQRQDVAEQPSPNLVVLADEQRQYIWNVEHQALILSKGWFKELAEAIKDSDAGKLNGLLAADFSGQIVNNPVEDRCENAFARVIRYTDSGSGPQSLDRGGFVAYLLKQRQLFSRPPHVKVYPKFLAPSKREAPEGTWDGTGVLRMWGDTGAPGQPGEVVVQLRYHVSHPSREPQHGWLRACAITQVQQASAPRFLFRDVTLERGIDPSPYHDNWKHTPKFPAAAGVNLCDFNRDGIIDMLIVDPKRNTLYQGLADGRFRDVTGDMGLPDIPAPIPEFYLGGFVDIDGDGWEDLLLAGHIYRNMEGKQFVDYTARCNLRVHRYGTGISVADFDGDGLLDIYVTQPGKGKAASWLDGHSGEDRGCQLWRNLGNWKFEEVAASSNTAGDHRSVFTAVWLDANNDGKPDLYVPNEFGNGVLLVNRGDGTFREHQLVQGPGDFGTMGMTCGDVNNDGLPDLYMANMYSKTGSRIISNLRPGTYAEDIMAKMRRFVSGSQLYLNRGDLRFEPVAQAWQMNDVGWAYGPCLADFDNDGFLDLFATSGFVSANRDDPDG